ncbi:putative alcohol dehydrogenase [Hypoxylon sp. FL1284]|nr:putative alcohol dehydrogenase [Hypoxylon sp. FL1284]
MMRAIEAIRKGLVEIREVPRPSLRDGWLLVKVKAVAINPVDCTHIDWRAVPGSRTGLDFAGTVEELGRGVSRPFKKGDRVSGWVLAGDLNDIKAGAFADYVVVQQHIPFKVPDHISDAQAATLSVGISTVAQGLYQVLGLPWPNQPTSTPTPILIHGGSTATGMFGIQFAKASGMRVVATASPHNFELVRSLGADAVFDYRNPAAAAAEIRAATGNALALAWKCAQGGSDALVAGALSSEAPSRYASIISVDPAAVRRANPRVAPPRIHLAYDVFGVGYMWPSYFMAPEPATADYVARFLELVPELLESGAVRPIPTIVNKGGSGLEGVLRGIDDLRANGISGAKLVYTL